ncbi:HAD hydrolase, TIGR02254 family [Pediococcus acidilactici D3]|nr:HAD hydrolase, TIGR02254 family [Pediococcus acidilactici D3]
MKRYQTLLFDVDDTLLDFHAAQDQALDQLFTSVDIEPTATVKQVEHAALELARYHFK